MPNYIRKHKVKLLALINVFLVFLLDQWTKMYVVANFPYQVTHSYFKVLNTKLNIGLNLFLTHNKGTAFSLIKQASGNVKNLLIASTIIITAGLFYGFIRMSSKDKVILVALSLILGGAIGNIYDRINLGYVIDFIDVYAGVHHWPVFNIADSAISIGAVLLCYKLIKN